MWFKGGVGLGWVTGYVLFLAAPAPARRGGYLAKIPTYGKHLSHNVYYGRDYAHLTSTKSLILLRTLWLCVLMVVYPIIYPLANDYQSQSQARAKRCKGFLPHHSYPQPSPLPHPPLS